MYSNNNLQAARFDCSYSNLTFGKRCHSHAAQSDNNNDYLQHTYRMLFEKLP